MEEEKKEIIDMMKTLALKMISHQEEINELSCKDEEDEMTMVVKRCKKLVLQKSQRMRREKQLQQNRFKGDSSRSNKFLQPVRTFEEWLSIKQGGQKVQDEEEDLGWNLVRIVIPPHPMMNRLLKQEKTFILWQKRKRYVIMILMI